MLHLIPLFRARRRHYYNILFATCTLDDSSLTSRAITMEFALLPEKNWLKCRAAMAALQKRLFCVCQSAFQSGQIHFEKRRKNNLLPTLSGRPCCVFCVWILAPGLSGICEPVLPDEKSCCVAPGQSQRGIRIQARGDKL